MISWEPGGGCVMGQGGNSQGHAVSFAAPYIPFSNPRSSEPGFVLVGGLDYTPEVAAYDEFDEMVNALIDRFVKRFFGSGDIIDSQVRKDLTDTFFKAVTPETNSMDVREDTLQSYLEEAYTFMTASFTVPLFDPVVFTQGCSDLKGGPGGIFPPTSI